ncbi:hypothetical protein ScPMuIL_001970 [Solemya velum]
MFTDSSEFEGADSIVPEPHLKNSEILKSLDDKLSDLPATQREDIKRLIREFEHIVGNVPTAKNAAEMSVEVGDADLIDSILKYKYPQPTDHRDVRRILESTGFYSRFRSNDSTVAAPMSNLLEKDRRSKRSPYYSTVEGQTLHYSTVEEKALNYSTVEEEALIYWTVVENALNYSTVEEEALGWISDTGSVPTLILHQAYTERWLPVVGKPRGKAYETVYDQRNSWSLARSKNVEFPDIVTGRLS